MYNPECVYQAQGIHFYSPTSAIPVIDSSPGRDESTRPGKINRNHK